jgi:two-component system, OmpR family, response regulator
MSTSSVLQPLTRPRILVVEDDPTISDVVATALTHEGYEVAHTDNGANAFALVVDGSFDLVVLDVMLPGLDGFEVCRRLRVNGIDVPIVFLTARDAREDAVRGFLQGGDDYMCKPFSVSELLLRVAARLKRTPPATPGSDAVVYATLQLSVAQHLVRHGGRVVDLTPTEFRLLHYLLVNAETVVSKAQILETVWRDEFGGRDNAVETYVSHLRRKLDHRRDPLIHTVRNVGYIIRRTA